MEKLGKIKTKKLYNRCLNLARRKPPEFFSFKRMRGAHGYCNWTDLEFNPSGELLATAYHECIHYLEPDWSETQVLYAESRVKNIVSYLDHALFLKHISSKLYKSELQKHILNRPKRRKKKTNKTTKNKK
jgi:hypothetical protein